MIVYGDPQHPASLAELVSRLRTSVDPLLARRVTSSDLDDLRAVLIRAGQLEQAAADGLPELLPPGEANRLLSRIATATDHAGRAFCAVLASGGHGGAKSRDARTALRSLAGSLNALAGAPDPRLTVKLPEGFAFYALYPEAYVAAVESWLVDHVSATPRRAVVAGIRSIGTTLSAVVAETLRLHGWDVHRLTLRPGGHPFERQASLAPDAVRAGEWALVVDEGPGLSGSSIAAVAAALVDAGLAREQIAFLPGHAHGPGRAASDDARGWWETTPQYVLPVAGLRWNGRSLPEALALETESLLGEPIERVEDLGGGLWRRSVYHPPEEWPAVCAPFERPKYRCVSRAGTALLWAFAGLAGSPESAAPTAEAALAHLSALARDGWTPEPLAVARGFVATRWVNGTPLTRAEATPALLTRIGRFIARAAGPPLEPDEAAAALTRLREMLYWNVWEILGDKTAERTHAWGEAAARSMQGAPPLRYGDGHLAPHEWVRTPAGTIYKMDAHGHDADHTVVGRQPLAWDLAGALVEWGLDDRSAGPLLAALDEAGGERAPANTLSFYRLAYAAFRAGQTSMCIGMTDDPAEAGRLTHAHAGYRDELTRLLGLDPLDIES